MRRSGGNGSSSQAEDDERKKRELFLEPKAVRKLMLFLDELRGDMVEFGANTGLRNANIRMLEWTKVVSNFSTLTIRGKDSKNGEPTAISLTKDAQRVLRRRRGFCLSLEDRYPYLKGKIDYVFAKECRRREENGKPYADCGPVSGRGWRKACRLAGLPDEVVFHILMHTFAS